MSDDAQIVETFTELAPRYEAVMDGELSRFWGWRYSDYADHLLEMTPLEAEDRVLDVATGTAVIPRKIINSNHRSNAIHGLDITPAMLNRAKKTITKEFEPERFCLTCASAMEMPYQNDYFDVVLCGLATHHMDAREMLSEMYRVLKDRGKITISDVGGSMWMKIPGAKLLLKIFAFIYYCIEENPTRAWAEAKGVNNIRSLEDWRGLLNELGFDEIRITQPSSKYSWIPKPMLIRASKNHSGGKNAINQ